MCQQLSDRRTSSALCISSGTLLVESCTGFFSAFKAHLPLNGIFWLDYNVEELELRKQCVGSEGVNVGELSAAAG